MAETYGPCPNHPGQSYNKSTGDCSCGSNHNRWASSNNPGGQKSHKEATMALLTDSPKCACAHHGDGSVTTMLCSVHAKEDPCWTMASVTGRRRSGSIVRGVCTNCGWSRSTHAKEVN